MLILDRNSQGVSSGCKCPKCQFDNPEDTLYCGQCGTRIEAGEPQISSPTRTLETSAQELATGALFAGRYQIIEELGHGGMGRVYRALDRKVNEEVALKLIRREIASERKTLERFQNELKTARRISHRNIGRMYELMEEKGTHFITMEYVPGEDLKSAIRRFGQLPVGKSLAIDPNYALAYAGLADAHLILANNLFLPPNECYPKAKQFAQKALGIDDKLADAYSALGYIKQDYEWDFAGAEREFKKAIEMSPSDSHTHQGMRSSYHFWAGMKKRSKRSSWRASWILLRRGYELVSVIFSTLPEDTKKPWKNSKKRSYSTRTIA